MGIPEWVMVALIVSAQGISAVVSALSARTVRRYRDEMLASNEVLSKQNDLAIAALEEWLGNARSKG